MSARLFPGQSARGQSRSLPLSVHLAALCAAVAIPLLALSGYLLYQTGLAARAHLEARAHEEARDISLLLDSHLSGMVAMLHAVATAPSLQSGDLAAFDLLVRNLVLLAGNSIVLRDLSSQHLVNTRLPPGAPLPPINREIRAFDQLIVDTASPQVSGVVNGIVAKMPIYAVGIPIFRDDKVVYLLSMGLPVEHLGEILTRKKLPDGWWATLVDQNGAVMARAPAPENAIGNAVVREALGEISLEGGFDSGIYLTSPEGIRNFTTFRRVENSGWTVSVAVPEAILLAPFYRSLQWIGLLVVLAVAMAGGLAFFYGKRIARGVIGLTRAATALGGGQPIAPHNFFIRELDAVWSELVGAERELVIRAGQRDDLLRTLGRSPAIVHGLDGRITFWGRGAERLYGWTVAEAMGQITHDLLKSEFPVPLADMRNHLLDTGHWEGEIRQRSRDGEQLIVASYWALQRDPCTGAPLAVVQTNTDMTAKMAEQVLAVAKAEAETASRAKSTFLAAASHDLRQPFQAMRLFHQVLEMKAGPELAPALESLGKAMSSGEELLAGILDLSVLETGNIRAQPTLFAIGDVLGEIAADCASLAAAENLTLRLVSSRMVVHTDRVLLKRMIRNLVVNAIRYTKEGRILIGCRRRGGALAVQVVDTGMGIPQEKLNWIFEEFCQVNNPARDRARGLGLGLAIVSRLSTLLGHPVSVRSALGKGSVFTVKIPLDQEPHHLR